MLYKRLPWDDREISCICMGSARFGNETPESLAWEMMDAYVEMGGNFLDTARVYGDYQKEICGLSENVIGRWLEKRGSRDRIFLATKGGFPRISTMNIGRLDKESLTRDLAQSLDALRTDHVDLYWLHRDDVTHPVGDIVDTLNGFVAEGKIRAFGASNWTTKRIEEANAYAAEHSAAGFSANEPQWALALQEIMDDPTLIQMDREMYEMHARMNLACVPFSGQAKGFFSKLFANGEESLPDEVHYHYFSQRNLDIYEALLDIRERTGLSVGASALAYLTCQPFSVFPIVGASRIEQVQALKEAGDAKLVWEDVVRLRRLSLGL